MTQQDGNLICWFVVTTQSIPGGAANSTPIRRLSHFHQLHHSSFPFSQIRSRHLNGRHVFISTVAHQTRVKCHPSCPTQLTDGISVSKHHGLFFFILTWLFSFLSIGPPWHVHTAWNRATPLTRFYASLYPFHFVKPGELDWCPETMLLLSSAQQTHTHSDKWRANLVLYCHFQNAWKLFNSKSIWVITSVHL